MDLTEFLLARIAQDEDLARDAASEGTPRRTGWQLWTSKISTTRGGEVLGPRGSVEASPARVLAECEAKRLAIEAAWYDHESIEGEWGSGQSMEQMSAEGDYPEVVKALGLPFADHPSYQEEWRPQ